MSYLIIDGKNVSDNIPFHFQGYNGVLSGSADLTVGGTLNWKTAVAATQMDSSAAGDDVGSTGAEYVYLTGIDTNYDLVTTKEEMNGTAAITITGNSLLAVNEIRCADVGSGGINAGNIIATIGGTTMCTAAAGFGRSFNGGMTVPRDKYYVITKMWGVLDPSVSSAEMHLSLQTRKRESTSNGVESWVVDHIIPILGSNGITKIEFPVPLVFEPRSELKLRATGVAGTGNVAYAGCAGYYVPIRKTAFDAWESFFSGGSTRPTIRL